MAQIITPAHIAFLNKILTDLPTIITVIGGIWTLIKQSRSKIQFFVNTIIKDNNNRIRDEILTAMEEKFRAHEVSAFIKIDRLHQAIENKTSIEKESVSK